MSYTKTTWQDGDVITADRLNNMENGIANAAPMVIVNGTYNNGEIILDKTWQEIYDAINNKIPVYICYNYNNSDDDYGIFMGEVMSVYYSDNEYKVSADAVYSAISSSGYPMRGTFR